MKKTRPLHRHLSKKIKKSVTGIADEMDQFFVGGEWKIAGFGHIPIQQPRRTREYEKMRVPDLARRIQNDLKELFARAYPTCMEERFPSSYWRESGTTYEDCLRYAITQSVAEQLCPGLWERLISQDKTVACKAREEYQRLLPQFLECEPIHAATVFSLIARQAATYLENLFLKRGALMKKIAAGSDLWPVNLGLGIKKVKGEPAYEFTRQSFARNYLIELELNSRCEFPSGQGMASHSPFRLAAVELYTKMLVFKDERSRRFYFPKLTPWAKRLFALTVPMTKSNSAGWWNVAKVYLYERWDKAQDEFKPLIKHLGFKYPIELTSKVPYKSVIKSRVIDNGLKDAFMALARADL